MNDVEKAIRQWLEKGQTDSNLEDKQTTFLYRYFVKERYFMRKDGLSGTLCAGKRCMKAARAWKRPAER